MPVWVGADEIEIFIPSHGEPKADLPEASLISTLYPFLISFKKIITDLSWSKTRSIMYRLSLRRQADTLLSTR